MSDSDAKNVPEYLISLRDGLQNQSTRTSSLENTLTVVQTTVTQLDQNLSDKLANLAIAQGTQHQQVDAMVHTLDIQVQNLRRYIAEQISELTTELRAVIVAAGTPPSTPPPVSLPAPTPNSMKPNPFLETSLSREAETLLPNRQTAVFQARKPAPLFSGTAEETPRPFLSQIHQYTSSTYKWDKQTLFENIGQFLEGTAYEWYGQILASTNPPTHWDTFQTLFLQQFSSPLRAAQIEQQWKRCIQEPKESINNFLTRIRTLWSEHKPEETEQDLVRHLFAKIRPELVSLIGVLDNPTFENFLQRARGAEVIEFSRLEQSLDNETRYSKPHTAPAPSTNCSTSHSGQSKITCYSCHTPGHLSTQCPHKQSPRHPYNSKN